MSIQKNNYINIFKNTKVLTLGNGYLSKSIEKNFPFKKNYYTHSKKKILSKTYFSSLEKFIEEKKIKIIINCIGNTSKNQNFDSYYIPNILLPLKILDLIKNKKILFVNFSSTDETIIKNFLKDQVPPPKEYNYGLSKKILSIIIKNKTNNYILNIILPVVYGNSIKTKNLYNSIISNNRNRKITFIKFPSNISNFIKITDFCNLLWILINNYNYSKRYLFESISDNNPITVKNFVLKNFKKKYLRFNNRQEKVLNKSITSNNKLVVNYFK